LRGLSARSPALAALLALSLFSLVGLPPLAGFLGKFLLFSVAARSGHYALIFVAAVAVALSFFYYMRLVREAYLPVPADDESARLPLELGLAERCAAFSLAILLVLLGTWPGLLAYITARS
jgi:NADH-quinone oxidoreductase subunit N